MGQGGVKYHPTGRCVRSVGEELTAVRSSRTVSNYNGGYILYAGTVGMRFIDKAWNLITTSQFRIGIAVGKHAPENPQPFAQPWESGNTQGNLTFFHGKTCHDPGSPREPGLCYATSQRTRRRPCPRPVLQSGANQHVAPRSNNSMWYLWWSMADCDAAYDVSPGCTLDNVFSLTRAYYVVENSCVSSAAAFQMKTQYQKMNNKIWTFSLQVHGQTVILIGFCQSSDEVECTGSIELLGKNSALPAGSYTTIVYWN